jgi:hypothetical protein
LLTSHSSFLNCSRKPGVSSIHEEAEGFSSSDDMGTVDGDDADED